VLCLQTMRFNDSLQGTHEEVEIALLAIELTKRRVELVSQLVGLAVTVALAVVAAICALRGSPWPVSAGTGFAAIGFRVLAEGRGGRRWP
jgi:hypothetical protein